MSDDFPKIRGVILDSQFIRWPVLNRVRNEGYPNTVDWFLVLVSLARDAMAGGRIEISGSILLPEDIAVHMPRGKFMPEFDPNWLTVAVDKGLISQSTDGCYSIPRWKMWWSDSSDSAAILRDMPVWKDFLDFWHTEAGERWCYLDEIIPFAVKAKIRMVLTKPTVSSQSSWLGKKLSDQIGSRCGEFTIDKGADQKNKAQYKITRG